MQIMDRKWKSGHVEIAPNCPRCASSNTKFCYYNNYSLSQPRYFCKACRRYWTKGGSLRNVPVGGGCRKSRRYKSNRLTHHHLSISSPTGDSSNASSSSSDIDLAVVFANFLNQEPTSFHQPDTASEEFVSATTNSLTSDSDTAAMELEFQPPATYSDDLIVQDSDLLHELEFPHEFGLQSLLGDELVQDALWSDNSNNVMTWQPEEFDSLIGASAGDDQLKIPANLSMIDNVWSSFDLSGF